MKTSTIVWIVIALAVVIGGGYWWSMQSSPGAQDVQGTPSTAMGLNGSANQGNLGQPDNGTPEQPGTGLVIGDNLALGTDSTAALGTYLIGYNGMTVYTYAKDTGNTSNCYGTCATNWPPYIVAQGDSINHLKLGVNGTTGTTVRTDGQLQLTYNGKPLYFYIGDKSGSDTTGQGLGGVWYVVKP